MTGPGMMLCMMLYIAGYSGAQDACGSGFVACKDGRCEPYAALCDSPNPVKPATVLMTSSTTQDMTSATTPGPLVTGGVVPVSSPAAQGVNTTVTVMPDSSTQTPTGGSCPLGFSSCKDGRCEPYEALCGTAGIVTIPTPASTASPVTTATDNSTMTTGMISLITALTTKATAATPTMTTSTTTTTTTTTLPPMPPTKHTGSPETCQKGWEQCRDGSCEPFHWLCVEHDILVG